MGLKRKDERVAVETTLGEAIGDQAFTLSHADDQKLSHDSGIQQAQGGARTGAWLRILKSTWTSNFRRRVRLGGRRNIHPSSPSHGPSFGILRSRFNAHASEARWSYIDVLRSNYNTMTSCRYDALDCVVVDAWSWQQLGVSRLRTPTRILTLIS
jgi:hypothetical protein